MKIDVHFTKSLGAKEVDASPRITLTLANRIGADGRSAYDVAVQHGFTGTEAEWLDSLLKPSKDAAKAANAAQTAATDSAAFAELAAQSATLSERSASTAAQASASSAAAVTSSAEAAVNAQAAADRSAQQAGAAAASASASTDAATQAQGMAGSAVQAATEAIRVSGALQTEIEQLKATANSVSTGIKTSGGRYAAAEPTVNTGTTVTIEMLFTTDSDIITEQTLLSGTGINLRIRNTSLVLTMGNPDITIPNVEANTTYHLVLTADPEDNSMRTYLNDKMVKKSVATTWFSTLSSICMGGSFPFAGIIHHCRIFAETFSAETVRRFWNEACPHLFSLPGSYLPANGGTCLAEYIPESISGTRWADTSGNGFHLHGEGDAVPAGLAPGNMSYRMLTSGLVLSNGNFSISLRIPPGYFVDQIVLTNHNSTPLETIVMKYLMTGAVVAEIATLNALGIWACNPMATGRVYTDGDYLYISGKYNTNVGGCTADVRLVCV